MFVSILTFLSCTVNPNATIATEVGTWLFGVNRIVSTVLGVLIALVVNLFTFPRFIKKSWNEILAFLDMILSSSSIQLFSQTLI